MMENTHNPHLLVYGYHYTFVNEYEEDGRLYTGVYVATEDRSSWNEEDGKIEFWGVHVIRLDNGEEKEIPDFFRGTRTYREG